MLPNAFNFDAAGQVYQPPPKRRRNGRKRRPRLHGIQLELLPSSAAGLGTWIRLANVVVDQATGKIQSADISFVMLGQYGTKTIRP